uniref:Uncharacterized protein n=1 Tax=Opuntia streptacantha TaxID=393608 RepID=A0A7C9A5W1_OPUST
MAEVPSLLTLCLDALKDHILYGDDDDDDGVLQGIYELPAELFDCLLRQLPALALHKLQSQMPSEVQSDFDIDYACAGSGRKRTRHGKFDAAWKVLFYLRWPELTEHLPYDPLAGKNVMECESINDWRQKYWEMHVQNCFDAAAERAMLPSFDGRIGEIIVPDALIKAIGFQKKCSVYVYSRLHDHCQGFGAYTRFLRLPNVFCNVETCYGRISFH